jgi:hypothetical protein
MLGKILFRRLSLARFVFPIILLIVAAVACSGAQPAPTATTVPPPTLTPQVIEITPTPRIVTATPPPTGTATATATATATQAPAQVVLSDDFSGRCSLGSGENSGGKWGCENGEYVLLMKTARYPFWTSYLASGFVNIIYEADARVESKVPKVNYGLLFRRVGNDFFVFEVSKEGGWSVWHHPSSGQATVLLQSTSPLSALKLDQNHLKVVVQNDQAAVYLNDTFVNSVNGISNSAGTIGVYQYNPYPNTQVAFDNVLVTRLNQPMTLPAPVPTAIVTQPPATRPKATVAPPTSPPVSTNPCNLQPGQSGLLVTNNHDFEVKLTIGGKEWGTHDYFLPAKSTTAVQFPPGLYSMTLNIPGLGNYRFADGRVPFEEGKCYTLEAP